MLFTQMINIIFFYLQVTRCRLSIDLVRTQLLCVPTQITTTTASLDSGFKKVSEISVNM